MGRFVGDVALAAVGSNSALINLLTNFFIGLSIGSNVLVSHYFGAKKTEETSSTVHTSILLSFFSGIILTVAGVAFAPEILKAMQTPESILPLAILYIRIYFFIIKYFF